MSPGDAGNSRLRTDANFGKVPEPYWPALETLIDVVTGLIERDKWRY